MFARPADLSRVERLILWAIVERGQALSSLTTEDAIAYRALLRRSLPRERWVGQPGPRDSVEWRPFTGGLSARSASNALVLYFTSKAFRHTHKTAFSKLQGSKFQGIEISAPF